MGVPIHKFFLFRGCDNMSTHNRDKMWRTADGRSIPIKDMEVSHLVNVINWVSDNSDAYPKGVLKLMVEEANHRKLLLFAEGKAYPQKVDGKWKVIDPITGKGSIIPPPQDYIDKVADNENYQAMFKKTQDKRKKRMQNE